MTDRRRAVFLDRDGTLIEDVGILNDPCAIRLFPDTGEDTFRIYPRISWCFIAWAMRRNGF